MRELSDLIKRWIDYISNNHHEDIESNLSEAAPESGAVYDIVEKAASGNLNNTEETIFRPVSREITRKKPIKIKDDGYVSRDVTMRETDEGLERHVEKCLIIAACGKVIDESAIGVRCSVCNQYDCKDHAFLCHCCGRALCIVHTHFFKNEAGENTPYCEKHYRETVENQDTWKSMPGIMTKWSKRNEASDAAGNQGPKN